MKRSFGFTVKLVISSSSVLAGSPISLDRVLPSYRLSDHDNVAGPRWPIRAGNLSPTTS